LNPELFGLRQSNSRFSGRAGKILRLDPRKAGARPEVVALGLRNPVAVLVRPPQRAAADRRRRRDRQEEVDLLDPAEPGPVNLGWPVAAQGVNLTVITSPSAIR
jgi:hypothetical protein